MMGVVIWIISIIATLVIADQKGRSVVGYFFLSLIAGPVAVIIVLCLPSQKTEPRAEPINSPAFPSPYSSSDPKTELNYIKESMESLQRRILRLESTISAVPEQQRTSVPPIPAVMPTVPRVTAFAATRPVAVGTSSPAGREPVNFDMESMLGRYWLNKVGIAVFTLGIGFLISYTFKSFGPFLKIAFGYLVSSILFYGGWKIEKNEKLVNFGRVLMGGGWAIVYFTTYAMHHFPAARIIQSQGVDFFFLLMVVTGMIVHSLSYKSEEMMSIALFVAYITATLGPITHFTVISLVLLAVVILFLVYNFQWVKSLAMGVILTYGVHYIWVAPRISAGTFEGQLSMNLLFLTAYWLVFLVGAHLAKTVKGDGQTNMLAAINFGNSAVYASLAMPIVFKLFYPQRFWLVLATGFLYLSVAVLMKLSNNRKMYISDMITAFFFITFAVPLRFESIATILVWLVEIPFLLYIGLVYKEKVYRGLAYVLTFAVGWQVLFFEMMGKMNDTIPVLGKSLTSMDAVFLWTGISTAVSFYLLRSNKEEAAWSPDQAFSHVFPAVACGSFVFLTFSWVNYPWLTVVLALEAFILLGLGFLLARFRLYAYVVLVLLGISYVTDFTPGFLGPLKWLIIGINVLTYFGFYFVLKYWPQTKPVEIYPYEDGASFWAGITSLVFSIFRHTVSEWTSLNLGLAGITLIVVGFLTKDKLFRLGGLGLLFLTLCKVILFDLAGLDVIFKIITFMVLGVLLIGVSYIYNQSSTTNQNKEKT